MVQDPTAVCTPPDISLVSRPLNALSSRYLYPRSSSLRFSFAHVSFATRLRFTQDLSFPMADLTSPVSGPSAFGALAALALNCMLQPCGSVCGFPPRLRTYLRSSP